LTALQNDQLRSPDKKRNYIDVGYYYKWIKNYLEYFPKEQILLLSFHELQTDSNKILHQLCPFLEIEVSDTPFPKSNVATPIYPIQRYWRNLLFKYPILDKVYIWWFKDGINFKTFISPPKHVKKPPLTIEAQTFLEQLFQEDTNLVEQIFKIKIT
jgi:hypothetical protein